MTAADSILTPAARPPAPPGLGRGITLALLVHAALIVALAFGVNWHSSEPAGIEAELWAAVPQAAAPKVEAPPKVEQPPPKPKPEPAPPPPKATEPPQPTEAEIALEKARREKALREQQEEQERRQREEELKRRQAEEQKKQRERETAEREAQRKREQEEQRLAKQREEQERRDEERLAKQRQDNLNKMLAQAGGTGAPTATGTAARSAGPSSGYRGKLIATIKPNILFGDEVSGNPAALVEVRAAADGTITARKLVKSSGVKSWDDAVLRAIDRTEMLPRDVDGRVPSPIEIEFRPKD